MNARIFPRIWAVSERLWTNGPSSHNAGSPVGAEIWKDKLWPVR